MIIYLVRHGESEWNRKGIFQGSSDPPLSQKGIEEAQATARRFQYIPLQGIYCSGLIRAIDTAEIISHHHPLTIQKEVGLNERMMGEWEGLTQKTIKARYRNIYLAWQKNRQETLIPGGESYPKFQERVLAAFHRIVDQQRRGPFLISTHEGVIKALLCGIFQLPIDGVKYFRQANTGVNILEKKDDLFFLTLFNSQEHLQEFPPSSEREEKSSR